MVAQMEPQQVVLQPQNNIDCAIFAFINLWRKMGLDPPSRFQIDNALIEHIGGRTARIDPDGGTGLSPIDILDLCADLSYPGPVCYSIVPRGKEMRDCLPSLLDAGCGCLVSFVYEAGERRYKHSVVVQSYTDEYIEVLCSVNGILCIPWTTVDFDYFERGLELPVTYFQGVSIRYGLYRSIVALWPQGKSQQSKIVISAA